MIPFALDAGASDLKSTLVVGHHGAGYDRRAMDPDVWRQISPDQRFFKLRTV